MLRSPKGPKLTALAVEVEDKDSMVKLFMCDNDIVVKRKIEIVYESTQNACGTREQEKTQNREYHIDGNLVRGIATAIM
jgi:hypothetical protein